MKIYCINLKRSVERRAKMEIELRKTGLDYAFIDGVDGRLLSAEALKANYSPWRSRFRHGMGLTRGEIGCALSHVKFFHQVVAHDEVAFVVEDDVAFSEAAREAIEEAAAFLQTVDGPAIVQLPGLERDMRADRMPGAAFVPVLAAMGTYAYGINPAGARLMLKVFAPVRSPADKYGYVIRHYGLKFFVSARRVVFVDDVCESQVGSGRVSYSGLKLLIFKCWRCIGVCLDALLSRREWGR